MAAKLTMESRGARCHLGTRQMTPVHTARRLIAMLMHHGLRNTRTRGNRDVLGQTGNRDLRRTRRAVGEPADSHGRLSFGSPTVGSLRRGTPSWSVCPLQVSRLIMSAFLCRSVCGEMLEDGWLMDVALT